MEVCIYNPLDFSVNLTHGPGGEPALSFELWCQDHNVYLGTGVFDSEVELKANSNTYIVVTVSLTPDGAAHVLTPVPNGHYDPWPPPGRIRMRAMLRNGVAYVAIYEVVVRVTFTVRDVYIDEPVPTAASSVNTGLQEIGHLHERLPCLGPAEPLYGLLRLLRELLH